MWMVYDSESGLAYLGDDYDQALVEYERFKKSAREYVTADSEFIGDETVVLAKVERHYFSYDTEKPVMEEDEEGNEHPTVDTYWDFKEEIL